MAALHFLRPGWFLALAPLAALLALLWRRRRTARSWRSVVDPGLLPHLLVGADARRGPWGLAALALGGLLAVTALAGPVWSRLKQPVFRRESALVILLDLSRSMDAADLEPSRLQRAKFKLRDLLAGRKEGETALVVYAADPFVVAPLTGDTATIERQLASLTTDLMPAQGSRADLAIAKARALLEQAGAVHGDVLLLTDGVENTPRAALEAAVDGLRSAGYRLSVLGIGGAAGAPIPLPDGGFFKDAEGAIVVPKLREGALARLAARGGGQYRRLAVDDSDTESLARTFDAGWGTRASREVAGMKSDEWREEGPWLLLPLLAIAAFAFRRGVLLLLCLAVLLPVPRSALALDWSGLWQRPDQRGARALAAHRPKEAAKLFEDPRWRAAAHYRAEDYAAALRDLRGQRSAAAAYNRGNALAHLGRLPEALGAYEEALKRDPGFKDAEYNRDLVKRWLKQTPPASAGGARRDQERADNRGAQAKPPTPGQPSPSQRGRQPSPQGAHDTAGARPNPGSTGEENASAAQRQGEAPGKKEDASTKESGQEDRADRQRGAQLASNAAPSPAESTSPRRESDPDTERWLARIPDDPGGLWRRKFLYQYKREHASQDHEAKPW